MERTESEAKYCRIKNSLPAKAFVTNTINPTIIIFVVIAILSELTILVVSALFTYRQYLFK